MCVFTQFDPCGIFGLGGTDTFWDQIFDKKISKINKDFEL